MVQLSQCKRKVGIILNSYMAKQKNTENKKLHTKLLEQKKNKKQSQKELNKARIRLMNQMANQLTSIEE
jgi:hypothetical protein